MKLTADELAERLPSGTQGKFDNRVAWAKSYLVQALVLSASKRGIFRITDRGRTLHAQGVDRIDINTLSQYPEFLEFRTRHPNSVSLETEPMSPVATPEETLQQSYDSLREHLASELLAKVKENSPAFFENLVVDLMVAMGYGGSRADAGKSIGHSGDEGVDGIIKEDRLGLDVIYLQAKRWAATVVGRPEIQKFVGALVGKRAKKGVFLTTGKFSDDARSYVDNIEQRVILIDGRALDEFMIDFNIGTSTTAVFPVKRIDSAPLPRWPYFRLEDNASLAARGLAGHLNA